MSVSFRSNASLSVFALALALAAFSPTGAMAQTAVESYADQIPGEGVMPQGMTWNKPLKAGDMVLPRTLKPKPKSTEPLPPTRANQPVGGLKAPQLGVTKDAKAPQITKDKANSTQGMMLMQGMKSALHQVGQNPDIPKSDLVPAEAAESKDSGKTTLPAFGETPKTAEKTLASAAAVPLKNNEHGFVAGQEPKGWVSPDKTIEGAVVKPVGDDGTMEIIFPPEMSGDSKSDAAAPASAPAPGNDLAKATIEMPKAAEPAAPSKAKEESKPGLLDRMTKPFTSIFGDPVDETKADTKAAEPAAPVPPADRAPAPTFAPMKATATGDKCEPSVTKWMRECADAGYPSHFVGEIIGETRIECPSGDAKDVWLSNSCAAPVGNSSFNDADTRATNLAEAPSSLRKLAAASNEDLTGSVDGACGPANGLAAADAPSEDLCAQGMSTSVSGEGPWRWSCKGRRGGMTVSCAAPVATGKDALKKQKRGSNGDSANSQGPVVEDGKCGEAHGTGTDSAPAGALCIKGVPSRVNGSGPWTWACSGTNGGMAAACTAPKKVDGACGEATDKGAETMPMQGLCAEGYASAVTGSGPWNWTCSGLHGGSAATCTAAAKINAVCGPASLRGHDKTPSEGLCNVGKPTEVAGNGPWNWTCTGDLGGASVSCNAKVSEDGACGAAHGNQYVKAPTQALCTSGTPSRVSGVGPWNWNCGGTNGGETVSCTASLGSKESVAAAVGCGEAAEGLALGRPSDKLCASGATASDVTGDGPWKWTCSDNAGHVTACSTLTASDGTCGKAANTTTREAPMRNLCASGAATEVVAFEKKSWRWECNGALGGKSTTCFAPMKGGEPTPAASTPMAAPRDEKPQAQATPEVKCGAANGMSYADKPPMTDLCESGKASAIKGTGPWTWTCASKKAKANCEASRTVDGACGAANGSIQRTAPTTGLCSIGTATEVSGEGPWMWSCVGSGNGTSTSCSANAQSSTKVDGACGAATNTIMTSAPRANLCDSGMPSDVHGEGPWTWTCSGVNGGIASTCGTAKVMPQAPPPPGPMVNGVCGSANGQMSSSAPSYALCSSGTPTALSGEGPWNWGCIGSNGGMTVSCTAPLTPPAPIVGVCGSANGVPTLVIPKSGLCAAGITSAVNGKGPWTWSCSGTNGGGAVSCVAPLAGGSRTSSQGQPSLTTPSLDGDAPAPRAAPAGLVTPTLPSGPLPAIKAPATPAKKSGPSVEIPPLPAEALTQPGLPHAPAAAPSVPVSMKPVNPPAGPKKDRAKADAIKAAPVSSPDSLPGARLVLDSDVSTISFTRGSDQMDKDAIEIVEKLSRILMANPMARITLVAYSDTGGTVTPRDARRISLNRALAIRDFMATKGVSSGRVDVRPMGANVPSGDMDRVDVKVN